MINGSKKNMKKIMFILLIGMLVIVSYGNTVFGKEEISRPLIKKDENPLSISSGPQEEWNVTFGGNKYDLFFTVQETTDGGFITLGGKDATAFDIGGDCWLVKTDENGVMQWNRTFGGNKTDNGHGILQTSDGGFIISALTESFGAGSADAWVIKTNATGVEQWNKTYGGVWYDVAEKTILQTSDGGFLVVGSTRSFGAGGSDGWLIKIDATGNEQWNRTYGTQKNEHLWEVHITSDGGYVMIGFTEDSSTQDRYAWVVKTYPDGVLEWEKRYGPANQGLSIQQTADDGYVLLAEVKNTVYGGYLNAWMVKIDHSGNQQWDKLFITPKGVDRFAVLHNIKHTSDGCFIMTGVTNAVTPVYSVGDLWLTKVDQNGNILWEKILSGSQYDSTYTVEPTSDDSYIISGMTKSFGEGDNFNAWLVKISDYDNQRPSKPDTPSGKIRGKTGTEYTYTSRCTEPDGESLYYIWDWGDNNYTYWVGPSNSGQVAEASYSWGQKGEYAIWVKTKDIYGGESSWSDPFTITMPCSYIPFHHFFDLLFQRFPNAFPILRHLVGY